MVAFRTSIVAIILTCMVADATAQSRTPEEMRSAAATFLQALDDERRAAAHVAFDADERFNWHYVPRDRNGLPLKSMTDEQRKTVHALLRAALSSQGYLKASAIMFLDAVLRELENGNPMRDPENYYVTVFGNPSNDAVWGWRFEGHHLSLNFASVDGALSVTPAFFGANPGSVPTGPAVGLRVLADEEDLGRALAVSLTPEQRKLAILSGTAPDDIVSGTERRPKIGEPEGIPASAMTAEQQAIMRMLIEEYVGNMDASVAAAQLERIDEAGFEHLHYAWAGGLEPGQGHYYRIHGPTVLFEYDNTQNGARHPHSVWRDLENDFGEDLLKTHYEQSPHHRRE